MKQIRFLCTWEDGHEAVVFAFGITDAVQQALKWREEKPVPLKRVEKLK